MKDLRSDRFSTGTSRYGQRYTKRATNPALVSSFTVNERHQALLVAHKPTAVCSASLTPSGRDAIGSLVDLALGEGISAVAHQVNPGVISVKLI